MLHAIKVTFEKQRPALLRFAIGKVGNYDDAEDAVQNTGIMALQIWERYDATKGIEGISNWLYCICWNMCSKIRTAKPKTHELTGMVGEPTDGSDRADRIENSDQEYMNGVQKRFQRLLIEQYNDRKPDVVSPELAHRARYCLRHADMNPKYRKAILNKINGMSREQSARELGMTVEGLKSALKRGVREMQRVAAFTETVEISPQSEHLFNFCSEVTVYYAPQKVGATVARERLATMTEHRLPLQKRLPSKRWHRYKRDDA